MQTLEGLINKIYSLEKLTDEENAMANTELWKLCGHDSPKEAADFARRKAGSSIPLINLNK